MKELIGTWWKELSDHSDAYFIVCAVDERTDERDTVRILEPATFGIPLWISYDELERKFKRVRCTKKTAELELTHAEELRTFTVDQRKHYDTYLKGEPRGYIHTL